MRPIFLSLCLAGSLGALCACQTQPAESPESKPKGPVSARTAMVELFPVKRHQARGLIKLSRTHEGVRMRGEVTGLSLGYFGFAIHDKSDCLAAADTLGDYFNPGKSDEPAGKLDDLHANEQGVAEVKRMYPSLDMQGPQSIIGKTIAVHAWAYDPKVDIEDVPIVACGVIRAR